MANLAQHPELLEQLTAHSIELVPMPASHQLGNFSELYSIEAVMNSRPILLTNKDSDTMLISPKMLLSPYLTPAQLQSWVIDVLTPLTNPSSVASLIAKNHQQVANALQEALLLYLQGEGLRYKLREGDNS